LLAAIAAVLAYSLATAQGANPHRLRFPPPSETPFLETIYDAAARLHLTDLRTAAPGAARELRVWDGFGMFGVRLIALQETPQRRWRAFAAYPADGDSSVRILALPDTTDWARRWRTAVGAGLLHLPPYPARDTTDFLVNDGYSAVIEWFDGAHYGVSGAANPTSYCSRDDERLLAVLSAVLARPELAGCGGVR
jgi:hypothetical protein